MPKTTAKQKKRCKPWFNTECKDAKKARKSAVASFKTNITSETLSKFRIARAKARRACRENKRDLEKAYDTTCKHGILLDLSKTGLRGRLPMFICNFFI